MKRTPGADGLDLGLEGGGSADLESLLEGAVGACRVEAEGAEEDADAAGSWTAGRCAGCNEAG